MGFKRKSKEYHLRFADPDLAGLEIVMGSLTVNQYNDITAATKEEGANQADIMVKMMAAKLLRWNLDDEQGDPVPQTLEGVQSQDLDFVQQIVLAWMEAIAAVPPPLQQSSKSSERSLEASMPMEPLSGNPPS